MAGAVALPDGRVVGQISRPAPDLPRLRPDLQLLPGPMTADGAPTWTIHDPVRHRFMRIGWAEFEILSRWELADPRAIVASMSEQTTIRIRIEDVLDMAGFLGHAGLLETTGKAGLTALLAEVGRGKLSASSWLLKNYLFVRLRLLNPDGALAGLVPLTNFLFTRAFVTVMIALAVLALFLIGRQWDRFTHDFEEMFSFEGIVLVGIALSGAKMVHEFGHGIAARHFGCKVPAMGVALMVLWPVLWTDTTDAWRLTDRRQRLIVDIAGMAAELVLAVLAGLAWALLAPGPLRTAAFLLCSSTWLITLAVNLNPLMRFDGYFILSDALEIPNLQERGFAMGRWRLREILFNLGAPPPEKMPAHLQRIMLIYAWCTWVYRFFLFVGIAVLVYHLAFKLLGLFLMAVEIWWFLARPILREIATWFTLVRPRRLNRRTTTTLIIAAIVLLLLALPWRSEISAPAILRANQQALIYTIAPGELARTSPTGRRVAAGDELFRQSSETLQWRHRQTSALVAGLRADIAGMAFDPSRAERLAEAQKSLEGAVAELRSIENEETALVISAPFAGVLTDVPLLLRLGITLPRRELLGILIDPSDPIVEAYVEEGDITRFAPGSTAHFYPGDATSAVPLTTISIAPTSARTLEAIDLASIHGGPLGVRRDSAGRLVPEHAVYRVLLRPSDKIQLLRRQPGYIVIDGDRVSPLRRIYDRAVAVIVRESGL